MTITYNPQTALIVVDMQNDFAMPDGSLYVKGGETLIDPIALEVEVASLSGAMVVFTQDWHPAETPHFGEDAWPVHCVQWTEGAKIVDGLPVSLAGAVIRKGTGQADGYSAFDKEAAAESGNDLDYVLKDNEITTLVVVGLAGDFCVKATAVDGAKLGYRVVLPFVLTRFVELTPTAMRDALLEMDAAGVEFELV